MSSSKVVPFNPLDKKQLGETVAQALLRQGVQPLGELRKFIGAGIYAIYYTGNFPAYQPIAQANSGGRFLAPIYAGKAIPAGGRTGSTEKTQSKPSLFERLRIHQRTVEAVNNLDLADFHYRCLVVDDIWIPLGETLLITKTTPIWNKILAGFGNNDPGSGRHKGKRSRWDVLHPGRPWADKLQQRDETQEQLEREVLEFLKSNPPPEG